MESAEIGRRIRRVRESHGFSQRGLARAAGVMVATLNRLERGRTSSPHRGTLVLLALELGVTVEDLVE